MKKVKSMLSWILILVMALSIFTSLSGCGSSQKSNTEGSDNGTTTVTIYPNIPDGISQLELGITHTQLYWEYGNATAVARATSLLKAATGLYNQHIMGWGAGNPQPTEGGAYSWSELDHRVNLMRSLGGTMIITFCTAPGWMKTSGQDWNMEDRVADNHVTDFANLCAAVAQRYTDVKCFQVWNEMKGYWNSSMNNWDYYRYTTLYNAVYDKVKSVRPDALIGGPYLVIQGDGSNTIGLNGTNSYTPIGSRDWDVINYWLANKHGADFFCCDSGIQDYHDNNTFTEADDMALTSMWSKRETDLRSVTSLPIIWSEYYSNGSGGSQFLAAENASMYYWMIKGDTGGKGVKALLWDPEEGEINHYIFTSTAASSGGQPTPHYAVFKNMHDYFAPGTQLVKAVSSSPNIEVLATAFHTMLINKNNTSQTVVVNGTTYTLSAYEVRIL
jgi:hypothetical protein